MLKAFYEGRIKFKSLFCLKHTDSASTLMSSPHIVCVPTVFGRKHACNRASIWTEASENVLVHKGAGDDVLPANTQFPHTLFPQLLNQWTGEPVAFPSLFGLLLFPPATSKFSCFCFGAEASPQVTYCGEKQCWNIISCNIAQDHTGGELEQCCSPEPHVCNCNPVLIFQALPLPPPFLSIIDCLEKSFTSQAKCSWTCLQEVEAISANGERGLWEQSK